LPQPLVMGIIVVIGIIGNKKAPLGL